MIEWILKNHPMKKNSLNFVKESTWEVISDLTENQWNTFDGPYAVEISIYNKIKQPNKRFLFNC